MNVKILFGGISTAKSHKDAENQQRLDKIKSKKCLIVGIVINLETQQIGDTEINDHHNGKEKRREVDAE